MTMKPEVVLQERLARSMRRMSLGSLEGRSEQAMPQGARPRAQPYRPRTFFIPIANSGPMAVGRSTPYPAPSAGHITLVTITARTAGSGDSTFQVRVGGTLVGSVITLPSGDLEVTDSIGFEAVGGGQPIDLECLTVGAGLADLGGHVSLIG